jgi:signal transduction histidine kinase
MPPHHQRIVILLDNPKKADEIHATLMSWGFELASPLPNVDLAIVDLTTLSAMQQPAGPKTYPTLLLADLDSPPSSANLHQPVDLVLPTQVDPMTLLGVIRLLLDHHRLQRQIQTSHRLAGIGKVTTGLLHALKGPIHNVVMSIERINQQLLGHDPAHRWLDILRRNADLLHESIDHLLQGFHDHRSHVPVDIVAATRKAISYAIEHCATQHQITLVPQWSLDAAFVLSPPGHLLHLMIHLLDNAREAIGDRPGTITVSAQIIDNSHVQIQVTDTGHGIAANIRERLGEEFLTTKPEGTGLGLATILGIVRECGGHLDADAPAEGGSRFTIRFPIVHPPSSDPTC